MARASHPTRRRRTAAAAALASAGLIASAFALVPATPAGAGSLPVTTRLVSRNNAGSDVPATASNDQVFGSISQLVAMSGNGRFVAFVTGGALPGDTNGFKDVYVRDLWAGTTERVSVTDDEKPVLGDSFSPQISDDGRFVLFLTKAANLIPGDDKGLTDAFLRDRYEGTTRWVSSDDTGDLLTANVNFAVLSGDGNVTAFSTTANNVVAGDTNNAFDIYARENFGTNVDRVSVSSSENGGTGGSDNPSISDDGRYVAFTSDSLLASGVNGEGNVYVRDRKNGTTEIASIKSDESLADHGGGGAYISGDGRYVMFSSDATNMVSGDTNGVRDVFRRDRTAGTTIRVSLSDSDAQLPTGGGSTDFSGDGATAYFFTNDKASSAPDAGGKFDVYARNIAAGTTRRITTGPSIPDPTELFTSASPDQTGRSAAFYASPKLTGASFDQVYVNGPIALGPFASSSALIGRQYQDFAGRAATATEVSAWSNKFTIGDLQPPKLIADLATAPAWSAKRAPLVRLYWAFFLRRPDSSGLTYWLKKYQSGSSLTSIAQSFAKSSEFKNRYGTVTNAQYVNKVYVNVFKRLPDASGAAYWTKKLDTGALSRGAVIVQFSESTEGKRRLEGVTDITLVSLGMFGTVPTASQWSAVFEHVDFGEPQPAVYVAGTFLARPEYT